MRTIAHGSLGASVILFLVEFAVAAWASPNILSGEAGVGLTESQVEIVLSAYQGIGVGLLILAILFLGMTLALVGASLARGGYPSRTIATIGVVVGVANTLFGIAAFLGVEATGTGFPDAGSQVLTGAWVLIVGVAEMRRRPTRD